VIKVLGLSCQLWSDPAVRPLAAWLGLFLDGSTGHRRGRVQKGHYAQSVLSNFHYSAILVFGGKAATALDVLQAHLGLDPLTRRRCTPCADTLSTCSGGTVMRSGPWADASAAVHGGSLAKSGSPQRCAA